MRRLSVLTLLALLLLPACGEDLDPVTFLQEPRVLAILADPIEAGPGEEVTLEPVLYVPDGAKVASTKWRFCPMTFGPMAAYACLVPSPPCLVDLPAKADGSVKANPSTLALGCLAHASSLTGLEVGAPESVPDEVETVFFLTVELDDGRVRESVMRVPLHTAPIEGPRNRHPEVSLLIEGRAPAPGDSFHVFAEGDDLELKVVVDPDSLDSYVDIIGRDRVEEPIVSFFADAGFFDKERDDGTEVENTWRFSDFGTDRSEANIYVVVRDERGGQAVAGPVVVELRAPRLARSTPRILASVSAEAGRSPGSFLSRRSCRLRSSVGTSSPLGKRLGSLGGSAWICLKTTAMESSATKGGRPVSASWSKHPRAYRSERTSRACPRHCSGDMYLGVPMMAPLSLRPRRAPPRAPSARRRSDRPRGPWNRCTLDRSGPLSSPPLFALLE